MLKKLYCAQDGADFYGSTREADDFKHLASYPGKVSDYDMAAAKAARAWFIEQQEAAGFAVIFLANLFTAAGGK
jgi:hypothetical protein